MSKARDKAFQIIRDKILTGVFLPGERLKEEELADEIGVSRTPIRDALRSLAADYYVTNIPNHGTFVTEWSVGDIEDIFELRSMLEGYAARRAATRATPEQIAQMKTQVARIDAALQTPGAMDIDSFLDANRKLHALVTEAAGSERLSLMITRLVEQPVVARTAIQYRESDLIRSNNHHRELVEALETGDTSWADSVMTSHIQAAYQIYRRAYLEARQGALHDKAAE